MPAAIARDPEQTVFAYRGIISPPADWSRLARRGRALAAHLVERYGIDEVATWGFEVWNEPNLVVFWSGTQAGLPAAVRRVRPRGEERRRAAAGRRSVHGGRRVGRAPGGARRGRRRAAGLRHHAHLRQPAAGRRRRRCTGTASTDVPVWWTEWGVGSTHFGPIHDGVIGAPFVLSGFAAAQGRLDALAYWVISDHFEELGRPPSLFHNGFGLLTVGNLRKPRYWAVHLAAHLGDDVLACARRRRRGGRAGPGLGDPPRRRHGRRPGLERHDQRGADARRPAAGPAGPAVGHRPRRRTRTGPPWPASTPEHSNIVATATRTVDWPDAALWARLRAADRPRRGAPCPTSRRARRPREFELALPMPGVARIRLSAGTPLRRSPDEESSR